MVCKYVVLHSNRYNTTSPLVLSHLMLDKYLWNFFLYIWKELLGNQVWSLPIKESNNLHVYLKPTTGK